MKSRIITLAAVLGLVAALSSGEAYARGGGGGGGYSGGGGRGSGNGSGIQQQSHVQTQAQTQAQTQTRTRAQHQVNSEAMSAARPADSQRRDGTFLTTGTTANGSTTRPGNGQGLQDGSHLTTTTTAEPTEAP
jgi:hypothetical protein